MRVLRGGWRQLWSCQRGGGEARQDKVGQILYCRQDLLLLVVLWSCERVGSTLQVVVVLVVEGGTCCSLLTGQTSYTLIIFLGCSIFSQNFLPVISCLGAEYERGAYFRSSSISSIELSYLWLYVQDLDCAPVYILAKFLIALPAPFT